MQIDRGKFLEDGYLLIRKVVSPNQLAQLRLTTELLVDRSKVRSIEGKRNDPRSSQWYSSIQPRVEIDQTVDNGTSDIVDFLLGTSVHGVSHALMDAPETAITSMQINCSGLIDFGYTDWHRDSSAREQAPLCGLQKDLMENAPGYVQWNIALYDDDVFWLVPGSHKQPSDEDQRQQLLIDPTSKLKGGVPIKLKAGDGVVYPNLMMHWGSFYSSKFRRTLHLGFRSFGGDLLPYAHFIHWDEGLEFTKHLSEHARSYFHRCMALFNQEADEIERTLRSVIDGDSEKFLHQIGILHPGKNWRMTAVVLLCRLAEKIALGHNPRIIELTEEERNKELSGPAEGRYYTGLSARFSAREAEILTTRFAELNARLDRDAADVHDRYRTVYDNLRPNSDQLPNFESRPLRQFHCNMPENFGVAEFVNSW